MSTIEAVLSTRDNLDVLYPERMTYLVHHKGSILYTKFDMVDDKIKVIGGNFIDLDDTNMIYITEDGTDVIEPLTMSKCKFTLGYVLSDNDPIIIKWDDGEIIKVKNAIIR